uniref:Uncharacterized protein n=1 Tax=Parascaris equorum TaxID=6256 RepID=A0A914RIB1_PAREQ
MDHLSIRTKGRDALQQPKGGREKKLNDYAKSVADIDTRIEELQRRIEEEKRAKERIVHEIKAKVKSTTAVDYIPSKKAERPKSSSGYSGGYTPTPIAVLKAEKANAKEKQKENERQRDKMKEAMVEEKIKQRAASKSRPKIKFDETLSIEELFDDDVCGLFFENSIDFMYFVIFVIIAHSRCRMWSVALES